MRDINSLNCCSCGTSLIKPVDDLAKCIYCGNFNKILPNNIALIHGNADSFGKPSSDKKFKDLTLYQKVICLIIIVFIPLLMRKYIVKWYISTKKC